MKDLNITDFYNVNDGENWSFATRRAINYMKENKVGILTFPHNTYHFYEQGCSSAEYYPCNNDGGVKSIVFLLKNMTDIIVDGDGSTFVFHGYVSPFILDACQNITIKNVKCDTGRPFFTQGKIVSADRNFVELDIDEAEFPYRVADGNFIVLGDCFEHDIGDWWVLMQEFDAVTRGPARHSDTAVAKIGDGEFDMNSLPAQLWTLRAEETSRGTVILHGDFSYTMTVGNILVITHEKRDHSFMYVKEGFNTTVQDVTVYHSQSMGIIAQCTENLTVIGCRYEVAENSSRIISLNADGVHCVNCTGTVTVRDCFMDGMMDDGVNVHGIYSLVNEINKNGTVLLEHIHFQQFGVLVYFPNDEITFLDPVNMQTVGTAKVISAKLVGIKYIELKLQIPEGLKIEKGMVTENQNRMPDVQIFNNVFGRNRPRGILMNSPKRVQIFNNKFYNSSSAIQLKGGPLFWGESGATNDVTIKNNIFEDCAYLDDAATILVNQVHRDLSHGVPYHHNLTICNNVFKQFNNNIVYARLLEGLTVIDNKFIKTNTYPDCGIRSHIILNNTIDVSTDISSEYVYIEGDKQ